jgi:hypothetical protein
MQQEPLQRLLRYPVSERRLRCDAYVVLLWSMYFGRNPFRPRVCNVHEAVTVYFARLEQVFASSVVYPLPPLAD